MSALAKDLTALGFIDCDAKESAIEHVRAILEPLAGLSDEQVAWLVRFLAETKIVFFDIRVDAAMASDQSAWYSTRVDAKTALGEALRAVKS